MKQVNNGDILLRENQKYEAICADELTFVLAPISAGIVDYEKLEAYSNDKRILSLDEMGFSICGRK